MSKSSRNKEARNKEKPPHIANAKMLYLRLFRGSPQQLIALNGYYTKLYQKEFD